MFKHLSIARRLAIALGSVIAVFLMVAATNLVTSSKITEADRSNTRSHQAIAAGDGLLTAVLNMQSGARGFVISGKEKFLEPWVSGKASFDAAWAQAGKLTADDPFQQARLAQIKLKQAEFMAVAEATIALRRSVDEGEKDTVQLEAEFRLGKDRAPMIAFHDVQNEFAQTERELLAAREETAENLRTLNRRAIVVGAALAIIAAALAGWWVARSITRPIQLAIKVARTVAAGDLSSRIVVASNDEAGQLLAALKTMNENLATMVTTVRDSSESIATGSGQIAIGNADLSQRTEEQASNLQQTAASMEELSATVKSNAETARIATQLASSASTAAVRGGEVVGQVVSTMGEVTACSKKIADIIGVIDGIAFQTNILALNAAVEAARAGEQGRGFAVVASEVRSLAQRSAAAAKEIKSLITDSVEKVDAGSRQVGEAGRTMSDIVAQVRRVNDLIGEIGSATQEQTQGIGEVTHSVTRLDQVTQQNAALVEESAAAADSLSQQAARLVQAVSVFRLDPATAPG